MTAFKEIFTLGKRTTSLNLFNTNVNDDVVNMIFFFFFTIPNEGLGKGWRILQNILFLVASCQQRTLERD